MIQSSQCPFVLLLGASRQGLKVGGRLWTQGQHLVLRKGPIVAYACTKGLRVLKLSHLKSLFLLKVALGHNRVTQATSCSW